MNLRKYKLLQGFDIDDLNKRKRLSQLVKKFLYLTLIICGLIQYKEITKIVSSENWIEGKAKVTVSLIRNTVIDSKTIYYPDIEYIYQVDEIEYRNNKVNIIRPQFNSSEKVKMIVSQYPIETEISIFYNPKKTKQSIMFKGGYQKSLYITLGYSVFLFIVVFIMISLINRELKMIKKILHEKIMGISN